MVSDPCCLGDFLSLSVLDDIYRVFCWLLFDQASEAMKSKEEKFPREIELQRPGELLVHTDDKFQLLPLSILSRSTQQSYIEARKLPPKKTIYPLTSFPSFTQTQRRYSNIIRALKFNGGQVSAAASKPETDPELGRKGKKRRRSSIWTSVEWFDDDEDLCQRRRQNRVTIFFLFVFALLLILNVGSIVYLFIFAGTDTFLLKEI